MFLSTEPVPPINRAMLHRIRFSIRQTCRKLRSMRKGYRDPTGLDLQDYRRDLGEYIVLYRELRAPTTRNTR